MRISFCAEDSLIENSVIMLTGVTRSGTTILGKIIGSMEYVEYEFEPWAISSISVLHHLGMIEFTPASELVKGLLRETFYNCLLGRGVNLRPSDDSCVWNFQNPEMVYSKWLNNRTKADARNYLAQKNVKFLIKIPNAQPRYEFFSRTFPMMKIIHIVRHPFDVAFSVFRKRWMTDANFTSKTETFPRKNVTVGNRKIVLPYWVDDDSIEDFIEADEFSRGLIYWRIFMDQHILNKKSIPNLRRQFLEIKFEDFIRNPEATIELVSEFAEAKIAGKTKSLLSTVKKDKNILYTPDFPIKMPAAEFKKLRKVMDAYSYSLPKKLNVAK